MKQTSKDKLINESFAHKSAMARECKERGECQEAIEWYHRALFLRDEAQLLMELGDIYESNLDLSSALIFYKRAEQLGHSTLAQQKVRELSRAQGLQLLDIGSCKNILFDTKFASFTKRYPSFHRRVLQRTTLPSLDTLRNCFAYLEVNQYNLAIIHLQKTLSVYPQDIDFLVLRAFLYWTMQQDAKGCHQFWEAYKIIQTLQSPKQQLIQYHHISPPTSNELKQIHTQTPILKQAQKDIKDNIQTQLLMDNCHQTEDGKNIKEGEKNKDREKIINNEKQKYINKSKEQIINKDKQKIINKDRNEGMKGRNEVEHFQEMIGPQLQELYKEAKYDLIEEQEEKCRLKVKKGLELHPYHTRFLMLSGYFERKRENYQKALSELQLANKNLEDKSLEAELHLQIALTYNDMGSYLFRQQKYQEASTLFSEGLSFNASDWGMLTNRGDCYRALQDYVKALEDYAKAHALHPHSADLNLRLASIYNIRAVNLFNSKHFELALAQFQTSLQFSPNCALFHFSKAKCLLQLARKHDAIDALEQTLRLDDKHIDAAQLLMQIKMPEQPKPKTRKVIYLNKQK